MELRHLRYFLAVAQERHFGRAAQRLHMAQPPLSQQIRQLEAELGTRLFERTTRRVDLTDAGRLLVERATQILADVESAANDVAEVGRGAAGVLRVGFSGTATYRYMPEVVRRAAQELPHVRLQVVGEMLTPQMEEALLENRLDVAVLRPPVSSDDIAVDEIAQTPLTVALPIDHRLAQEDGPLPASALAGEDLVSYPRTSSVATITAEAIRRAGIRPRIVQEATETSTLIALVAAGLGISIIPAAHALPFHSTIRVRPLDPPVTVGLGIAWRAHDPSSLIAAFRDLGRRAAEAAGTPAGPAPAQPAGEDRHVNAIGPARPAAAADPASPPAGATTAPRPAGGNSDDDPATASAGRPLNPATTSATMSDHSSTTSAVAPHHDDTTQIGEP